MLENVRACDSDSHNRLQILREVSPGVPSTVYEQKDDQRRYRIKVIGNQPSGRRIRTQVLSLSQRVEQLSEAEFTAGV